MVSTTVWVRFIEPSLAAAEVNNDSTVRGVMTIFKAVSAEVRPWAAQLIAPRSRLVNAAGVAARF